MRSAVAQARTARSLMTSQRGHMYSATDLLVIAAPIALLFGSLLWVMVFLQTYRHFPKMDPRQRFWMGCKSATTMTAVLLAIVFVFLYVIVRQLMAGQ